MHVHPLVFLAGEPALDFLEIGEVVDLAEIRELLLRPHAQRIDLVDRAAERAVLVDNRRAVPGDVGLIDRDRLEHLDVVSQQRLGNTLMLTGSEEARSRMSSALAPKRRRNSS